MADQFKDRNHYLWTFVHFLPLYLKSGETEGRFDLEAAMKGLELEWDSTIKKIKAGDFDFWLWIFTEAVKSGNSIAGLKTLDCCPFKNRVIVYKKGDIVLGEVALYLSCLPGLGEIPNEAEILLTLERPPSGESWDKILMETIPVRL